jgi:DNA-binding NtrC family response regulator
MQTRQRRSLSRRPIRVLAIVPDEWTETVTEALKPLNMEIVTAHDRQSAVSVLRAPAAVDVVFTASILVGGTWREVLSDLSKLRHPPQLVVGARLGDVSLWCDVLESGAYDLIAYPFTTGELQRVLTGAYVQGCSRRNRCRTQDSHDVY